MDAPRELQAARRADGRRGSQAAALEVRRQPGSDSLNAVHTRVVELIRAKQAKVGISGLGYVGLPLAVEFARAGLDVTGFDVDESKIASINEGRSYIPDVPDADLAGVVKAGRLRATSDMRQLDAMDAIDICVPTPLRNTRDP